ncbi:glycoside hydrolase family 2 protein [Tilletiaria anomala UBC 951]|uniref:Beta-mannosidase A n=1 Tax=Tilletiaria anomala (strain ATCC 24038 / CBS 436.72 / UBC 951) TaxID=1037660 RepID=A0A066VI78_TILAU|nr:glycoside hydrolase family 2 protein [Tilletiaria anomala UBC 951]KDN41417.1 glycoside hydrolase family 2 protein [Tilletiaria anomala UBC 951]
MSSERYSLFHSSMAPCSPHSLRQPSAEQAASRSDSASSSAAYVAQEPNIHAPASGIWTLGSSISHSVDLPFPLQVPSNGTIGFGKGTNSQGGKEAYGVQASLQWWLSNQNGSVQVSARFPSVVHLDLIEAGVIDDPNSSLRRRIRQAVGLNEGTSRWIIDDTWTYTANLSPLLSRVASNASGTSYSDYLLYFQGLDTVANVALGGKNVGNTSNMFREWVFNVTDVLTPLLGSMSSSTASSKARAGANENLTLTFSSAADYAERQSRNEPYYPTQLTSPMAPVIDDYEYPFRNFIRKASSDFGWDWGPAYVPTGAHKPAWLIALSNAPSAESAAATDGSGSEADTNVASLSSTSIRRTSIVGKSLNLFVQGTSIDITRKGQVNNLPPDQTAPWVVNVTHSLWSARAIPNATMSLALVGTPHGASELQLSAPVQAGYNDVLSASFEVLSNGTDAPQLWWPKTFGEPKLYDLQLRLADAVWTKRTGFRTVLVNQEPVSDEDVAKGTRPGNYWHIELNGQRIYTQGVNIIPADVFLPRISGDVLSHTISSAIAAGQNLLRVWGGGTYQPAQFYDLADEMGILTWSETTFACAAAYPTYDAMIGTIREEVKQNVRNLNRHPSMTHWAGNNEGENMMLAVKETLPNGTVYANQYDYLFDDVILNSVRQNSRSLSYLPSSTGAGYISLDPYVPRYRNATPGELYGDAEHYLYSAVHALDLDTYPISRFVNEFGMHSMPSIYTIDNVVVSPNDYTFNSTVMRAHDKHSPAGNLTYPFPADDGQNQMTDGAKMYFKTPAVNATGNLRANLAAWSYATQQYQAMLTGQQILYYRLGASRPENNLGVAYWQLNSIWQGSDWGSIEWGGRWKVMHFMAARYQDHVVGYPMYAPQNETLTIYALSDDFGLVNGTAAWIWYDYSGKNLGGNSTSFSVSGINATAIYSATGAQNILPAEASADNAYLHLQLNGTRSDGSPFTNEHFWPFAHSVANAPLQDPQVQVSKNGSASADGSQVFDVKAAGSGVAAFLSLEHPEGVIGWFADTKSGRPMNNIFLRPGEQRSFKFVLQFDRTNGSWADNVVARSIFVPSS